MIMDKKTGLMIYALVTIIAICYMPAAIGLIATVLILIYLDKE